MKRTEMYKALEGKKVACMQGCLISDDGERTMKRYWHKIDGLVYIACIIGLCCLANYIEHM